jgi:hypothetical protein
VRALSCRRSGVLFSHFSHFWVAEKTDATVQWIGYAHDIFTCSFSTIVMIESVTMNWSVESLTPPTYAGKALVIQFFERIAMPLFPVETKILLSMVARNPEERPTASQVLKVRLFFPPSFSTCRIVRWSSRTRRVTVFRHDRCCLRGFVVCSFTGSS